MLVLASSGNNAVIYSGLIAAIVSGLVSLIGYGITAYIQNKSNKEALQVQKKNSEDTIKTQKEIAKMGQKEKLFYEKLGVKYFKNYLPDLGFLCKIGRASCRERV